MSILNGVKQHLTGDDSKASANASAAAAASSGWFTKRHMPASKRQNTVKSSAQATVTFARETFDKLTDTSSTSKESPSSKDKPNAKSSAAAAAGKKKEHKSPLNRLKWDGRSAIVDARIIGSAIEGFLRGGSSSSSKNSSKDGRTSKKPSTASTKTGWFSKTEDEDSSGDTCDTASLCATLKDLFVK